MFQFIAPLPLALYIHIPWCVEKCPYCDFNSHAAAGPLPEAAYIDALLYDLEQELPAVWGRPIVSIFIGGGTPSLLTAAAIDRLLAGVRARLRLVANCEITLEANPGTVEAGRFTELRATGVNRLSIGIQSFNETALCALGRIHGRAEAIAATEAAQQAGFDNVNLDLMFGLPGQSERDALADVAQAVALAPSHLSYYQLTVEPNTAFHHAPPILPEEEALWQIQQAGQEALATAGYGHYETSAYARPGRQCRHNLNYWQFGDYLGIGAGAHGKITHAPEQRIERRWKQRHPGTYLAETGGDGQLAGSARISEADAGFEFMMNLLRLHDGFAEELFSERTGLPLDQIALPLGRAVELGLLQRGEGRVTPTARGRDMLNELQGLFLPD